MAAHWDQRYRTTGAVSVSWYQEHPTVSLELLAALGVTAGDAVVDVGGGASTLVDHLLSAGHRDVTVVDLSATALDESRARVADPSSVAWVEHDLLTWEPVRRFDAWHDRAVLHFLVDAADRARYAATLRRTLAPGGAFVIGTFAEDGPTHCSALPVHRYAPDAIAALLGDVVVVESRREVHRTPGGAEQPFTWLAGRLR